MGNAEGFWSPEVLCEARRERTAIQKEKGGGGGRERGKKQPKIGPADNGVHPYPKSSVFSYLPGVGEPGHEHPVRAVQMLQYCLSSACLSAHRCSGYVPPQLKRDSDSSAFLCSWEGDPGNALAIQSRGGPCSVILRCRRTVTLSAPGVWRFWV